jgi:hypothetical protein
MKGMYSEDIVNAYRAISEWIYRGIGKPPRGGAPKWPLELVQWVYYQSRFFPRECYCTIERLKKEKGLTSKEIARLLRYPSSICHWLYHPEAHFGVKEEYWAKGLSREQGIDYIEEIIRMITSLRKGDPFCRDFRNILFNENEVNELLSSQEFIRASETPNISEVLSKLNVVLWHYCILLQGGLRVYSQEFHGPYRLSENETLFVKEYTRLKPVEVWGFASEFPCNEIIIYEVYKDMEIKIDILGHYWTSGHPSKRLTKVAISVNGRNMVDVAEVLDLYERCYEAFKKGTAHIKNYRREDWVRKWIELGYFWLKPLKDYLREDWRPPKEIIDVAVDAKEAEKARKLTQQHYKLIINAIMNLPKSEAIEEIARMHVKTIYQEW